MSLQDDFKAFLSDIKPSKTTIDEISSVQNSLREYLRQHQEYSIHCNDSYLSGSYAKHTCIRPVKDDGHRDVDVIIETDYGVDSNSADVIIELRDVLYEAEKYKSACPQTHSVGVELSAIDIDIVPLASDEKNRFIGSLDDASWKKTNPRGHIQWSTEVNEKHHGKYKPLVKIMKWWRRETCPAGEKWPKGITLEKIIADNFPEEDGLYEELVIGLMENIVDSLTEEIESGGVPVIVDPSLEENDLSVSYTNNDFKRFLSAVGDALGIIQEVGSCNEAWRKILGDRFPVGTPVQSKSIVLTSLMPHESALCVPHRQASPWPFTKKKPGVIVVADVTFPDGHTERIANNGRAIPKGCEIDYRVLRSKGLAGLTVKWQVVNTGEDAYKDGCPRGGFESSNIPNGGRHESTAYAGRHYVQCLVIKNERCVAHSKEFFICVE